MNSILLDNVLLLKKIIDNTDEIILLNEIEEKMNSNDEVMILSYKKDIAVNNFNDALKHFSIDSKEVKKAQNELYIAKYNLDIHPLVKKYNIAYSDVRKIYMEINKELFGDFQ